MSDNREPDGMHPLLVEGILLSILGVVAIIVAYLVMRPAPANGAPSPSARAAKVVPFDPHNPAGNWKMTWGGGEWNVALFPSGNYEARAGASVWAGYGGSRPTGRCGSARRRWTTPACRGRCSEVPPVLPQNDLVDGASLNTVFASQLRLSDSARGVPGANLDDLLSRQNGAVILFASLVGVAALLCPVDAIFALCAKPEVPRVDAQRVVPRGAVVQGTQPIRDGAVVQLPGNAMGQRLALPRPEHTVAVTVLRAGPKPAGFGLVNLGEEAIGQGQASGLAGGARQATAFSLPAIDLYRRRGEGLAALFALPFGTMDDRHAGLLRRLVCSGLVSATNTHRPALL